MGQIEKTSNTVDIKTNTSVIILYVNWLNTLI